MAVVEIKIPQLGEGLHEARILRFLKQPGEPVAQDEPIYEMETDKAVMEIESPAAGVLEAWTAQEEDVVPIGAVIGRIASEGKLRVESRESREEAALSTLDSRLSTPPQAALRNIVIPPRTRAYAKQKGLSDAELARLARAADGKLFPEAIDRYLAAQEGVEEKPVKAAPPLTLTPGPSPLKGEGRLPAYEDIALPQQQKTLIYRLQRGAQAVIPATMEMPVRWSAVEAVRDQFRQRAGGDPSRQPSQFLLFAWCVAQAAKNHPRFRSALLSETTVRQYARLHLGIAVARPDDELLLARVQDADALSFEEFIAAAQRAIKLARDGVDQTSEAMQLSLTNLASADIRLGIPVVAAPAVGTLFIGAPYDEAYPLPGGGIGFRRMASMVLTFDHRLVNGIGAANFLSDVRARVEGLREEFAARFAAE